MRLRPAPVCVCACSLFLVLLARPLLARAAPADGPSIDACIAASDEGQVLRDRSKLVEARSAFRTCGQSTCPTVIQRTCVKWLAELEEAIPTVVLAARASDDANGDRLVVDDATVELDGAPLLPRLTGTATPVDPGRHVFSFKRGATTVKVEALINAAEKNRLIVAYFEAAPPAVTPALVVTSTSPRDAPTRKASPVLPIVLAGIGVAALVTGGVLGGGAVADLHTLERDPCAGAGTCSSDQVHSVRTRLVVADVAFVAGIVAIAGAGFVWWLSQAVSAVSLAP